MQTLHVGRVRRSIEATGRRWRKNDVPNTARALDGARTLGNHLDRPITSAVLSTKRTGLGQRNMNNNAGARKMFGRALNRAEREKKAHTHGRESLIRDKRPAGNVGEKNYLKKKRTETLSANRRGTAASQSVIIAFGNERSETKFRCVYDFFFISFRLFGTNGRFQTFRNGGNYSYVPSPSVICKVALL